MNNFLQFAARALFDNKLVSQSHLKPKRYAFFIFIISIFMMLSPVAYSFVAFDATSYTETYVNVVDVFADVTYTMHNEGNVVSISDGTLSSANGAKTFVSNGYTVYIDTDLVELPEVSDTVASPTDSFVCFNSNIYYMRYVTRDTDGKLLKKSTDSGTYNNLNGFSFETVYAKVATLSTSEADEMIYAETLSFLQGIYISNLAPTLLIWIIFIVAIDFIVVGLSAFIMLFINQRGKRNYRLTYMDCVRVLNSSLILPALIAAFVGMITFSFYMITYLAVYFVRLFILFAVQFSKNEKYNIAK